MIFQPQTSPRPPARAAVPALTHPPSISPVHPKNNNAPRITHVPCAFSAKSAKSPKRASRTPCAEFSKFPLRLFHAHVPQCKKIPLHLLHKLHQFRSPFHLNNLRDGVYLQEFSSLPLAWIKSIRCFPKFPALLLHKLPNRAPAGQLGDRVAAASQISARARVSGFQTPHRSAAPPFFLAQSPLSSLSLNLHHSHGVQLH